MTREGIEELPIYPEHRQCAHPTTEQVLRLFSLAERHHLLQHRRSVQVFDLKLTPLERQALTFLGVPAGTFWTRLSQSGNYAQMRLATCGK